MAACAVFDFDEPEVGVEIGLFHEELVGLGFGQGVVFTKRRPDKYAVLPCLHQHMRRTVESIDFQEDRAALRVAAPDDDDGDALLRRRTDLRPDHQRDREPSVFRFRHAGLIRDRAASRADPD